jgi:hypothetical protein
VEVEELRLFMMGLKRKPGVMEAFMEPEEAEEGGRMKDASLERAVMGQMEKS